MKRIIDGKTFNTETATCLAEDWEEHAPEFFDRLYQTRHGAFFRFSGGVTPYGDPYAQIIPVTPPEAQAWLETRNFVEAIEKLFGEQPEAGEAESRITVRVPDSLKVRIEALAQANDQSLNAWIMRCLEACANAQTQDR